jgi:hypothetical protein
MEMLSGQEFHDADGLFIDFPLSCSALCWRWEGRHFSRFSWLLHPPWVESLSVVLKPPLWICPWCWPRGAFTSYKPRSVGILGRGHVTCWIQSLGHLYHWGKVDICVLKRAMHGPLLAPWVFDLSVCHLSIHTQVYTRMYVCICIVFLQYSQGTGSKSSHPKDLKPHGFSSPFCQMEYDFCRTQMHPPVFLILFVLAILGLNPEICAC